MPKELFTGEQMRRIDELISTNFENATPDDIQLYAKWEVQKARSSEEFEAIRTAQEREIEESIAISKQRAEDARSALDTLVNKAVERYERLG